MFTNIKQYRIPFQYVQGNCHDRAHTMALLCKQMGVIPAKIWAFSPCLYSETDTTIITIKDKNKISLSGKIEWRYHVALLLLVDNGTTVEPTVIDPSIFASGPVYYRTWLAKLKTNKLLHLFADYEWYLFKSWFPMPELDLPEQENNIPYVQQVVLPGWFPQNVVTDFFKYQDECQKNHWMEKGLAINETAFQFYNQYILPKQLDATSQDLVYDYKQMTGDVYNFETVFRDNTVNEEMNRKFQKKHKNVIQAYKKVYQEELEKWKKNIESLSSPT